MPAPPTVDVPFVGGGQTKLPPGLVPAGQLIVSQNCAMRKQGEIGKRWGFEALKKPPQSNTDWLGSFGAELLISGPVGSAGFQQHGWSPSLNAWQQKGSAHPIGVSTPIAYSGTSDCQAADLALNADTSYSGGVFSCYVYEKTSQSGENTAGSQVSFCVIDEQTGAVVMADQAIGPNGGWDPRVVSIGPYFVLCLLTPSALQVYVVDPALKTVSALTAIRFAGGVQAPTYDARAVLNAPGTIGHQGKYVAIAYASLGGGCSVIGFDPWALSICLPGSTIVAGNVAGVFLGVFSANLGVAYNLVGSALKLQWTDLSLSPGSLETIDSTAATTWGKASLTTVTGGWAIVYEVLGAINGNGDLTLQPSIWANGGATIGGAAGTSKCVKRSLSIAGDLFTLGGASYLPTVYPGSIPTATPISTLQATYFLLEIPAAFTAAIEVARFASSNAGGQTLRQKCPQVSVDQEGNLVWACGLGTQLTGAFNGRYSQVRGVARAVFEFSVRQFSHVLGSGLYLSGGFLSSYDGASIVEQGFHLAPEAPTIDCCNVACIRTQIGTGSTTAGQVASASVPTAAGGSDPGTLWGISVVANQPGSVFLVVVDAPSAAGSDISPISMSSIGTTPAIVVHYVTASKMTCANVAAAINAYAPAAAIVTASPFGPPPLSTNPLRTGAVPAKFPSSGGATQTAALTAWVSNPQTMTANLTPLPVAASTLEILDGSSVVAQDNGAGVINGGDGSGNTITGTINYATGALSITLSGGAYSSNVLTAQWTLQPQGVAETSDIYFPPDASSPGDVIFGSGWQIRPGSYIVITAQSNADGTPYSSIPGVSGGPVGYVWFNVGGVGTDPAPFSSPGVAGVECPIQPSDSATVCAQKFQQAVTGSGLSAYVTVSIPQPSVIPPTGTALGATTKVTVACILGAQFSQGMPVSYSGDFRVDPYRPSSGSNVAGSWIACCSGRKIMPGGYIILPTGTNSVTVLWFQVSYDGTTYVGQSPPIGSLVLPVFSQTGFPPSATLVPVQVSSFSTPGDVALAVAFAASGAGCTVQTFAGTYDSIVLVSPAQPTFCDGMAPYNVSAAGLLPDGVYEYAADYEWSSCRGELFQSAPSSALIANIQGASPTFDPFGVLYSAPGSSLSQNNAGHGMLLFGSPVGGCSPCLISSSLWATLKEKSSLAWYRTTVSPGESPTFYRATGAAKSFVGVNAPANFGSTAPLLNPDPTAPGATGRNPLTGSSTAPLDVLVFVDTTPDAQIDSNPAMYTSPASGGSVLPNDPGPCASFVHVHQQRAWLVPTEFPHTLWPSQEFTGTSQLGVRFNGEQLPVPLDESVGPVVGLASLDDKLVVFCRDGVLFITGDGPTDAGSGAFNTPQRVPCEVGAGAGSYAPGASAPGGIVSTADGIWFQSPKGLYFIDRNMIASYRGQPAEDWTNPPGLSPLVCMQALVAPTDTEIRWFMAATPGAASQNSDYCVVYNYVTQFWAQSMKFAANAACLWSRVGQAPVVAFADGGGNVYAETPGQYLDNGAAIVRSLQSAWWGKQAGEQGFARMSRGAIYGRWAPGLANPIASKIRLLVGYDFEQPITPVVWDETSLLTDPVGDGTIPQFRFFVPPGPRGGRLERLSIAISDIVSAVAPDDPGFQFNMVSVEVQRFEGLARLGPLRTTG